MSRIDAHLCGETPASLTVEEVVVGAYIATAMVGVHNRFLKSDLSFSIEENEFWNGENKVGIWS